MRLIDADELKKAFDLYTDRKGYLKADPEDLIDNAPTIEGEILTKEAYSDLCLRASQARPQGEWIYPDADIVIGKRRIGRSYKVCSVCKVSFTNNIPWNANFCPNCGAEVIKNEG